MSRAPFQVLVLPFVVDPDGTPQYAVFRREDEGWWQGIAGGGEDGETPLDGARREAREEAGIASDARFITLAARASVPVTQVAGFLWGDDILVIPEYAFGAEMRARDIRLSSEHSEVKWVDYESARQLLRWDSNRTALWELNERIARAA